MHAQCKSRKLGSAHARGELFLCVIQRSWVIGWTTRHQVQAKFVPKVNHTVLSALLEKRSRLCFHDFAFLSGRLEVGGLRVPAPTASCLNKIVKRSASSCCEMAAANVKAHARAYLLNRPNPTRTTTTMTSRIAHVRATSQEVFG